MDKTHFGCRIAFHTPYVYACHVTLTPPCLFLPAAPSLHPSCMWSGVWTVGSVMAGQSCWPGAAKQWGEWVD